MLDYKPPIEDAAVIEEYSLGRYKGTLRLHPPPDEQTWKIKYLYSLAVTPLFDDDPVLFVTSEFNETAPGAGSHFLGVFSDIGHENNGASDDWGTRGRFVEQALAVVCERLLVEPADVHSMW